MAERLPFGQLTPAARPINAFIAPAQTNTPEPARPQQIGTDIRIGTIQRASEGSVQGFNQFEQIAESLKPFNRGLTDLLTDGFVGLKKQQIESGYYDELKNQAARATLGLQLQQEAGAANAAGQITQLEKIDPPAAELLRQSNPWAGIGRRRALAQRAGAEIDNALAADLEVNAGEVSAIQPGSAELARRKTVLTQGVLDRYGLTGNESEVGTYVIPELNQAWDQYTTKQNKLYREELKISTIANATAALGAKLVKFGESGIPLSDGSVVSVSDPGFSAMASQVLTGELDRYVSMLGGSDKGEALKQIREQIAGTYGVTTALQDAIQGIRGGNPQDPDERRPTWGATNPLDLMELQNRRTDNSIKLYENGQKAVEQELDGLWWKEGMPGAVLPTDPRYPAALIEFRNQAATKGYRDIDSYMKGRMDSQESVVERAYAPDPLASQDFLNKIDNLPPSRFTGQAGVNELLKQAREAAKAEPTRELQAARYKEYSDRIRQRAKAAEDYTPGLKQDIEKAVLQDLAAPAAKALKDKSKAGAGNMFTAAMNGGADPATAVASSYGSQKLVTYTNNLQNLYLRASEDALNDWREKHPGQALSPAAKNRVVSQAIASARKSPEYAAIYEELAGKKPGQVGDGSRGGAGASGGTVGPRAVGTPQAPLGVPREAAGGLPDSRVRNWRRDAVMAPTWLRQELDGVSKGKPVSADLYRLANRAGTSTYGMLLQQLQFYPQLDPGGDAQRWLREKVRQQRVQNTVSSAQYGAFAGTGMGVVTPGFNPLAPGGWLMRMLTPPAAAATLPAGMASAYRSTGGGGGGGYVATTGFGYSADRKTQTLHGIQGRPGYDANHGVGNDHVHHGANDQQTALALARHLKARGWPITEFKPWGRVGKHQDPGHYDGRTFDIPVATKDHGRVLEDINAFYAGRTGSGRQSSARGGGMTGLATYYTGSGGSDGVAGGPTANGERYNPNAMTAAVQWSLRGKYMNKWVTVEDASTGNRVRVWVNDVGQMGGSKSDINRQDPRVIDLSPAAFRKLFGSTSRGVGRVRIVEG